MKKKVIIVSCILIVIYSIVVSSSYFSSFKDRNQLVTAFDRSITNVLFDLNQYKNNGNEQGIQYAVLDMATTINLIPYIYENKDMDEYKYISAFYQWIATEQDGLIDNIDVVIEIFSLLDKDLDSAYIKLVDFLTTN